MIALQGVHKAYRMGSRAVPVLNDVSLEVGKGEMVAITGASGSGKSTLLNILGILDDYDAGSYVLDGELIRSLPERRAAQVRSRCVGFVFQAFNLLPFKTAAENVALPLYYQKVPRKRRLEQAREMLGRVGLADRTEHLPTELSGGQQQRVAIARALIAQPRVLLADEPTGALDSETSAQVMDLLQSFHAEGVTVILVTHEPSIAARAQRLIRLVDGRVVA